MHPTALDVPGQEAGRQVWGTKLPTRLDLGLGRAAEPGWPGSAAPPDATGGTRTPSDPLPSVNPLP